MNRVSSGSLAGALVLLFARLVGDLRTASDPTGAAAALRRTGAGRGLVTEPGLHFKLPLIETVVYLDNRILDLRIVEAGGARLRQPAARGGRLRALQDRRPAEILPDRGQRRRRRQPARLGAEFGRAPRAGRRQPDADRARRARRADGENPRTGQSRGRAVSASPIVDARIRRVDLPRQISEKVFDRMRTERAREAAEYRALGQQEAQQIRSSAQRDATVIVAEAQQQARHHARRRRGGTQPHLRRRLQPDPDFFAFYRSMQAYDAALKGKGARFVVSPSSDFFRYFDRASGKAPAKP